MMPSLSIGGYRVSQGSTAAAGFSSQTSASFYDERYPSTPLSQMNFSQEGCNSGVTGPTFPMDDGFGGIDLNLNVTYSDSPAMCRAGHVTDDTGLPRSLFTGDAGSQSTPNPFEQMTGMSYAYYTEV